MNPDAMVEDILRHQRADGGFPYAPGGASVLESTAWCLLAVYGRDPKSAALAKGAGFLVSLQNKDGGFFLFPGDDLSSAYGTALAAITLKAVDAAAPASRLEEAAFYLRNDHRYARSVDLDLDVWGWNHYTNIGTEPTALAVLALKHLGSLSETRGEQAARFFADTKCDYGGWSYGAAVDKNDPESSSPVCTVLPPHLHVTAVVMLAMQDKPDDFRDGLKVIESAYPGSSCPMSLSLSAFALDVYGGDARPVLERLNGLMTDDSQVRGLVYYRALAAAANQILEGKNPLRLNGKAGT